MTDALLPRSHFASLAEWTYLNQASLGLIGQPAVQAMHTFLDEIARHGNLNMSDAQEVAFFEALRDRGASLFNSKHEQIAILGSASELLGQLPFLLRPPAGSHILAIATDFPALTRPWLRYATANASDVRFVADDPAQNLTDTLIEQLNAATAVVAISYVQFATGSLIDVPRLRAAAHSVGARLIVDVTQAAGRIPIDCAAWRADAVVSSGYKWLGGHGGVALAALAPDLLEQTPPLPGWMGAADPFDFHATALPVAKGARRYALATMSYVSMAGLAAALDEILALPMGQQLNQARELSRQLVAGCAAFGWRPFRPLKDAAAAPHIVTLAHPTITATEAAAQLRQTHIICGERSGRLRISLAAYNRSADIAALVDGLAALA